MRKRFQNGNVRRVRKNSSWSGRYYDETGRRVSVTLGPASITKSEAREKLAEILRPINTAAGCANSVATVRDFVEAIFFPWKRRSWKRTTAGTTEARIKYHILAELGYRKLADVTDEELQTFLDRKADAGLSWNVVNHLKRDITMIFKMAVDKRCIRWNPAPAGLLYTPRTCKKPVKRFMTGEEVNRFFQGIEPFEIRERLVIELAWAGLRPGELLALQRDDIDLQKKRLDIRRRVYRGDIDTPKSKKSIRLAGLSSGLLSDLTDWLIKLPDTSPNAWLFPSETLSTPLWKDTIWQDHIRPKLEYIGFGWVNFQVLRRTAISLARDKKADLKDLAAQFGHGEDVNANVYTEAALERKIELAEILESVRVN